jgi:hypothetical protein
MSHDVVSHTANMISIAGEGNAQTVLSPAAEPTIGAPESGVGPGQLFGKRWLADLGSYLK